MKRKGIILASAPGTEVHPATLVLMHAYGHYQFGVLAESAY